MYTDPWLPPKELEDAKCNLLEYYSRYYPEIKAFRSLSDRTMRDYHRVLEQIESVPTIHQPMGHLSAYDIFAIVTSERIKRKGKNKGLPYSNGTIAKRAAVIHDIYLFAECNGVCSDPLWHAPMDILNISESQLFDSGLNALIEKRMSSSNPIRYIGKNNMKVVVSYIYRHINDSRFPCLGVAVNIYVPTRSGEVSGSNLGDFVNYSVPGYRDRTYLRLGRSTEYSTGITKDRMKNVNAVRRAPVHIELQKLFDKHVQWLINDQLFSEEEIRALPTASIGAPTQRCSAAQLGLFIKKILSEVLTGEELDDLALVDLAEMVEASEEARRNMAREPVQARILRRNCISAYNLETTMDPDSEIRPISGHKTDLTYEKMSEDDLIRIMEKMDQRIILHALRNDSDVVLTAENMHYSGQDIVSKEIVAPKRGRLEITVITNCPGDQVLLEYDDSKDELECTYKQDFFKKESLSRVRTESVFGCMKKINEKRIEQLEAVINGGTGK